MDTYHKEIEIRWADLDPNFHVLHSRYYDFGAFCRMAFFVENGVTPQLMQELKFGPIIFREECIFKREIAFGDSVTINFSLTKVTHDLGRWSMVHELWKNKDTLAAIITLDGAWLDTERRKLTLPPERFRNLFDNAPKAEGFEIVTK